MMNKTNKNLIIFSLGMLVFVSLVSPVRVSATAGYVDNPKPYVLSISPDSINNNNIGSNIVITITGNGFIPSSIARVNGSDRMTTFIDYSHLLIRLNSDDTRNTDGIYINVFNGFPGGGYSNAELFTINKIVAPTTNNNYPTATKATTYTTSNTTKTTNTYPSTNQTKNTTNTSSDSVDDNDTEKSYSNLASNAIFGSTGFLPSGLIQWILFAIIILLIVILSRRVFDAKKKYDEAPMKTP